MSLPPRPSWWPATASWKATARPPTTPMTPTTLIAPSSIITTMPTGGGSWRVPSGLGGVLLRPGAPRHLLHPRLVPPPGAGCGQPSCLTSGSCGATSAGAFRRIFAMTPWKAPPPWRTPPRASTQRPQMAVEKAGVGINMAKTAKDKKRKRDIVDAHVHPVVRTRRGTVAQQEYRVGSSRGLDDVRGDTGRLHDLRSSRQPRAPWNHDLLVYAGGRRGARHASRVLGRSPLRRSS